MKFYAGIGSRETPSDVLEAMTKIADMLESKGYILRSGGANGADTAFERGAINKEIYLAWKGFNGNNSPLHTVCDNAMQLASTIHPAWVKCSQGAKKLHARNCYQVLGLDLNTPVDFVVCYTSNGLIKGGTATAINLAKSKGIPVFNFGFGIERTLEEINAFIGNTKEDILVSTFKQFSGIEYLAIDIANYYGLDKETFENRIDWVKQNQDSLETYTDFAEDKYLYAKSVNHLRKALKGLPTGHTVALDSVCSGLQLMSVMTGDESGCYMTGLIDPDTRTDAYTLITNYMNHLLGDNAVHVTRKQAKDAVMQTLYGSQKAATNLFGTDTPAYHAFHQALNDKCKGATTLLRVLLNAWNPTKDFNHWVLPDGFNAFIPVMVKQEDRVSIKELNYTMSVETQVNQATEFGLSLAANMTHSKS